MKVLIGTAAVLTVGAALALPAAARSKPPAHHTQRQAELNLLRAKRMIARWHVGFVDPSTGLVRSSTRASCRGHGRGVGGRYTLFDCTVAHGSRKVVLLYVAQRHNGFSVKVGRVSRSSG